MNTTDSITLDEFEPEDISDVLIKLEKSFGLKFDNMAFYHVNTFGELCDVFENHIQLQNQNDCSSQQAFYKVRDALCSTQNIGHDTINPRTKLATILPYRNRRQKVKEFRKSLGIDFKILTYPEWLAITLFFGLLISVVTFFFDWRIALSGILFFTIAFQIAEWLGKTLKFKTVGELVENLTKEHYVEARRRKGTYNKREVLQIIVDTFSNKLGIEKTHLTRDAMLFKGANSENAIEKT